MKKEELKDKLMSLLNKGKELSKDFVSKTKNAFSKQKKEVEKETEAEAEEPVKLKIREEAGEKKPKKTSRHKIATSLNIYDKREKLEKSESNSCHIKPMAQSGQRVKIKKSLFFDLRNYFSLNPCFSEFTINVLFVGSAVVAGRLLSLSFAREAKAYAAFIALFLIGLTIRYIKSIRGSLGYGLLAGFISNVFIFEWIYDTVLFGTNNYILAAGSLIGLSFVLALPIMLFALFSYQYKNKLVIYPLASACAWVALELIVQLISYKGFGFPWFVLGYSQYANLEFIQISSVCGAYGVSFLIVFCSFCVSLVIGKGIPLKSRVINLLLVLFVWYGNNYYGKLQLNSFELNDSKNFQIAIVQPNTHEDMLQGNMDKVNQTLNYITQVLKTEKDLDIIVWPESTIPGYLEEGPLKEFMAKASFDTKAAQIAGASSRKKTEKPTSKKSKSKKEVIQKEEGKKEDLVAAGFYHKGNLVATHHKRKLVPFGEFLPFEKQLSSFYQSNEITSLTGSFIEGSGPAQVIRLQEEKEPVSFGVQICFESIFPILWRLEALGGAEFFVNISNDGWFLDTVAPYQHLRINIFRAIENRRPILRSANSGISAYIDSFGKIKYQSDLNKEAIEIIDLALPKNTIQTFYTIYGDIFALLCLFLTFVFYYNCLETDSNYD